MVYFCCYNKLFMKDYGVFLKTQNFYILFSICIIIYLPHPQNLNRSHNILEIFKVNYLNSNKLFNLVVLQILKGQS